MPPLRRPQTRPLRTPSAPSTRGFRAPRLRLAPLRPTESVELDQAHDRMPEFVRWDAFLDSFRWTQGEHVTLVGSTGSGKTTLARQLLPLREYVVVLATKANDPSLYRPLTAAGYITQTRFDPEPQDDPRIIFKPHLDAPTREGQEGQKEAFRSALVEIFQEGGWCIYADEVRYLTEYLNLGREFETLWLQGRSLGVSIVAATQRPVSIPLLAFDQATHLFLWRNTDRVNVDRMAQFAGPDSGAVRFTIPRLPLHEALYINTRTGYMVRTRVQL